MAQGALGEKPELHLVRRYPVGREKVWRAWTDPQALSQWFGPAGADAVTVAELDVRTGGRYRIGFRTPDGEEHLVSGTYEDVQPLRRLAFTWAWQSTPERVSLVTLELREVAGGTELDFRHARFFDDAAHANHSRGWAAAFAKLDAWLAA